MEIRSRYQRPGWDLKHKIRRIWRLALLLGRGCLVRASFSRVARPLLSLLVVVDICAALRRVFVLTVAVLLVTLRLVFLVCRCGTTNFESSMVSRNGTSTCMLRAACDSKKLDELLRRKNDYTRRLFTGFVLPCTLRKVEMC